MRRRRSARGRTRGRGQKSPKPLLAAAITLLAATQPIGSSPASAADAGSDKAFHSEGDCEQIGAFLPVPVENVRSRVPDDFALFGESTGQATVFVTGGRCRNWEIDGAVGADLVFGLVLVLAHPREQPTPTPDGYDVWWLSTGDSRWHARLSALGAFSRDVPGISYQVAQGPVGGAPTASLHVPWMDSPFSMEATIGEVPVPGLPENTPSTHWTSGRHGRVLGSHTNTQGRADGAMTVIRAAPNSPLAKMLGRETTSVPGAFLQFHHSAVTRLVPDAA